MPINIFLLKNLFPQYQDMLLKYSWLLLFMEDITNPLYKSFFIIKLKNYLIIDKTPLY